MSGGLGASLMTAEGLVTDMISDGETLFVLEYVSGIANDTVRIHAIPVSGGSAKTLATETSVHTGYIVAGITIDADRVYYPVAAGASEHEIHALARTGGAPSPVLTKLDFAIKTLTTDAGELFAMDQAGSIFKLPAGASTPVTLGGGSCFSGVAIDATAVYCFSKAGSFVRIPRDGSMATSLQSPAVPGDFSVSPLMSPLVRSGDALTIGVWSSSGGCHVYRTTLTGEGSELSEDCSLAMVGDDAGIYASRDANLLSKGDVDLVQVGGSDALLGTTDEVRAMAIDAANVYFADNANHSVVHALKRAK